MENLMDNLNPAQIEAVTHKSGPLMIVAGAGTGKTTVITRRVAWLIQEGLAKSSEILALTFTEKAAGEMEERVDMLLPIGYLDISIHTFHGFCERILREHGMEIGLSRDFDVVDEIGAWLLARRQFNRFNLDYYKPLGNPTRHLKELLKHFAALKELQITPEAYKKFVDARAVLDDTEIKKLKELARAYETYEQILHEHNVLDFGGLILYTLKLLTQRPNILAKLRERYRYILVDEFQDTNQAQYDLVRLIAAPENNITVVGDDDQSIYKFRGASLSNILKFDEDYPDTKHVVLTINYRSRQEILDRAYDFIQNNNPARLEVKTGLSKKLIAEKSGGGEVAHIHEKSLEREAEKVAEMILKAHNEDKTLLWKDIGVLVRANDHADPFINAFERARIPYQFLAMRGLYSQPVVLDILAWLRIIDNPFDSVSSYRALNHPMLKISTMDLQRLSFAAHKQGKSLLMLNLNAVEDLSSDTIEAYNRVLKVQSEMAELARRKRATEMLVLTAGNSGLTAHINSLDPILTRDQFRALQQFYERVKQFEAGNPDRLLRNFLEELAQEQNAGETGGMDFDIETGPDTVRVMTIHSSKGLEFRHVFVVNLVDRRFPSQHRGDAIPVPEGLVQIMEVELSSTDAVEHLEEERRLCYVAMTRAKEKLYLTSAEDYGGTRKKKLSIFLHELGFEPREADATTGVLGNSQVVENISIDPAPIFEIPKQFSFTRFAAYRKCPLQYKFAHALQIPTVGNYQMSFGKSVHKTLMLFFEEWIKTGELPAENELMRFYESSWIDDWYPDDEKREEYKELGAASLKKIYEEIVSNPSKPIAVEQSFTIKVGGVIIKGQIDRVDELDDGLRIIDYKTGSPKELDTLRADQKDQLYIYQMAAEEIWKKPVKKLSYYYINGNTSVDFIGTEKNLDKVRERVEEVVAGIREEDFHPTPGEHCKHCDFANICESKKV